MITHSPLLGYVAVANLLGRKGTDMAKTKFVQRCVARGELRAFRFGLTPKVSELDLLKYKQDCEIVAGHKTKRRK